MTRTGIPSAKHRPAGPARAPDPARGDGRRGLDRGRGQAPRAGSRALDRE
jgi:hypothetical protein